MKSRAGRTPRRGSEAGEAAQHLKAKGMLRHAVVRELMAVKGSLPGVCRPRLAPHRPRSESRFLSRGEVSEDATEPRNRANPPLRPCRWVSTSANFNDGEPSRQSRWRRRGRCAWFPVSRSRRVPQTPPESPSASNCVLSTADKLIKALEASPKLTGPVGFTSQNDDEPPPSGTP
jgi:hypothetical protein